MNDNRLEQAEQPILNMIGGRAYDVIYMDCLATEFVSPVLHTLLPA